MSPLFESKVQLYVYPYQTASRSARYAGLENIQVPESMEDWVSYLKESGRIIEIEHDKSQDLSVFPDEVVKMIRKNDQKWKQMVPEEVTDTIERGKLFREDG